MPAVASHSNAAAVRQHGHAPSQRANRPEEQSRNAFTDMLDSATQDAPKQAVPATQQDASAKPGRTKDTQHADRANDAQDSAATDDKSQADASGQTGDNGDAQASPETEKTAAEAALEGALKDAAKEETPAKTGKDADPEAVAAAIATTADPAVKAADAVAAALTAAGDQTPAGEKATAPEAAAIGGQTPKLAQNIPAQPQGVQPNDDAEAVPGADPKTGVKPQFIVKGDEKPVQQGAHDLHAPQLVQADADTPQLATAAQAAANAADAAQTMTPSAHPATGQTQAASAAAAAAPATTTAQTQTAIPLHAVAVEISARASAGNKRFEIRLDPPELGKIDVRLDIDRHGQVTSRLIVEKAETLDLLRRDAPQLERALQDAGLKTSGDGLQFSLQQQTAQQQDNSAPQDTAQLAIVDETIAPDVVQRGYAQLAAARGGVDIRI